MHLRHFALFFMILALVSIPSTAKMFDLGNYTVDTRWSLPPKLVVTVNESLGWGWSSHENTTITIIRNYIHMANWSDDENKNVSSLYVILGWINATDKLGLNSSEYVENIMSKSSVRAVSKPYPGFIALSTHDPTTKFYVGSIDLFNVLIITSSESDERMALLLRGSKVYSREQGRAVRLRSIQKEVEGSSA